MLCGSGMSWREGHSGGFSAIEIWVDGPERVAGLSLEEAKENARMNHIQDVKVSGE